MRGFRVKKPTIWWENAWRKRCPQEPIERLNISGTERITVLGREVSVSQKCPKRKVWYIVIDPTFAELLGLSYKYISLLNHDFAKTFHKFWLYQRACVIRASFAARKRDAKNHKENGQQSYVHVARNQNYKFYSRTQLLRSRRRTSDKWNAINSVLRT